MTWNDGWVWVLAASIGYRTGRIRMPDLNRNFGVGSDLAPRYFFHCIPDLDLELGPLKRWVLSHMCSRCLDNIILPIIAREALALKMSARVPSMSHRTPRGAVVFSNISINFPERFVDVAFIC